MSKMNYVKNLHPKLEDILVSLVADSKYREHAFYGYFAQHLAFVESTDPKFKTFGVTVSAGRLIFKYNKEYFNGLTEGEALFCYAHEVMHLVGDHWNRLRGKKKELVDLAMDMIVNEQILSDSVFASLVDIPEGAVRIHPDYKGELILEPLYDWLEAQEPEDLEEQMNKEFGEHDEDAKMPPQQGGEGQPEEGEGEPQEGDGNGEGEGEGGGQSDRGNGQGESLDQHAELSQQQAQSGKEAMGMALNTMKNRGQLNGNMKQMVEAMQKEKNTYLTHLKQQMAEIKGAIHKDKTYRRPHRTAIMGLKGKVKHGMALTVILDTSGSMHGAIHKILGTVLKAGLDIQLIQIDTKVQAVQRITSPKELAAIELKGFGGTIIQPAIDYAVEHMKDTPMVLMTDGYTDNLDMTGLNGKIVVLTTHVMPPYTAKGGKVKEIKVDL